MIFGKKAGFLTSLLLLAVALVACGAASEPSMAAPAQPQSFLREVEVAKEVVLPPPAPVPASATTTQESAALAADEENSAQRVQVSFEQVNQAVQNRIIVRTVTMSLVVSDVPESVDRIGAVARDFDGWVVSSDRNTGHDAFVAIRVPAQLLDQVILQLRQIATKVEYEATSSQDVTDEYVDTESRLRSLEATEQSLLELLGRAGSVKDALEVQQSLAELQVEIEAMKGRIRFLQETSAFSLVNVNLKLSPATMPVDAGLDQTFSVGQAARFRASFAPPPGLDEFTFTWDLATGRSE